MVQHKKYLGPSTIYSNVWSILSEYER